MVVLSALGRPQSRNGGAVRAGYSRLSSLVPMALCGPSFCREYCFYWPATRLLAGQILPSRRSGICMDDGGLKKALILLKSGGLLATAK